MFTLKTTKRYQDAYKIAVTLKNAGHRVLFAGGCVRDSLLNRESDDIDIATSALPEEIQALFPRTLAVGAQFGVIIVLVKNESYEVATFRKDGNYSDGRRPDSVAYSDEKEDAKRRDFTVNGLFWDPFDEKILDYVGGQQDLKAQVIRTIGKPVDRFEEDKLRLLRAIRFAARLGFEIEKNTLRVISEMAARIIAVSRERIRDEVFKMFKSPKVSEHLELMKHLGLWKPVFGFDFTEQNLKLIDKIQKNSSPELRLFSLLWQKDEAFIESVSESFKLSNKEKQKLLNLQKVINRFPSVLEERLGEIKRLFRLPDFDEILLFLEQWQKEFAPEKEPVLQELQAIYNREKNDLEVAKLISGDDLKKMGLKPSPLFKTILHEIENLQLENRLTSRAEALKIAEAIRQENEI